MQDRVEDRDEVVVRLALQCLGESQLEAESTSLLAIVPVAIAGVIRQRRYGNVRLRDGIIVGLLSVPGVILGVLVANAVSQRTLELGFAGLVLVIAAQLFVRAFRSRPQEQAEGG